MKPHKLIRFIQKHHLGGLINKALWQKHGDTIQVAVSKQAELSGKPDFLASVKMKDVYGIENGDIGVGDLNTVRRFIANCSDDSVLLSLEKYPSGEVAALQLSADSVHFRHQTICRDELKQVLMLKPDCGWDAAIVLESDVRTAFIKAFSAIEDRQCLFTVVVSKRVGSLCIAFGYYEHRLRDSVYLRVSCVKDKSTISRPVSFEALVLKKILNANAEFKDPILYVSEAGFASIGFSDNEVEARYDMKEIEVED